MGDEIYPLFFFGIVALSMGIYFFSRSFDRPRIEEYLAGQGGTLIHCRWTPFGPGWYGEKDSRIYQITYRDRDGRIHEAHVKTSMLSGVYLTNDQIVSASPMTVTSSPRTEHPAPATTLTNQNGHEAVEAEKRRLRARLAELEARYPTDP